VLQRLLRRQIGLAATGLQDGLCLGARALVEAGLDSGAKRLIGHEGGGSTANGGEAKGLVSEQAGEILRDPAGPLGVVLDSHVAFNEDGQEDVELPRGRMRWGVLGKMWALQADIRCNW
jgi:hypothetical protein